MGQTGDDLQPRSDAASAASSPGSCPRGPAPGALSRGPDIVLAHGGGGALTDELLEQVVLPRLGNDVLDELADAGVMPGSAEGRAALTIDSYVVQPWRFPGGDIGRLAVSGTVNDLAVCGAEVRGLALGLIIAEGFARADLEEVLESVRAAAGEAGVRVVTGDTKVVGRHQADGIYIATAGFGVVPAGRYLSLARVRPGDLLLINGPVGEHGLAVMLAREMPDVRSALRTDAAPLNGLIADLLGRVGDGVAFMRDPTRAGLAGVAAELAARAGCHVVLEEEKIPVRPETRHTAEMLGLDPLEVANEGKLVAVARPEVGEAALAAMRAHPLGAEAQIIGRVEDSGDGLCELHTTMGGRRLVQKPYGEQLTRIC